MAVDRTDHAHQLRPVAGADQLPEPEFSLVFIGDPGIIADLLAVEQLQQLLPAQKPAELGDGSRILHGDIEPRPRLVQRLQAIIFRLFLSKTHPLNGCNGADAVDAIEDLIPDLIHKNPSEI